jgi:uncharacterized protein
MDIGAVAKLWRYPVKSMLGEECGQLELEGRGFRGDRLFAVRDGEGKLGSGKNTRRFRVIDGLFNFHARSCGDFPEVVFPNGLTMRGDDPAIHNALSVVLGTAVTLAREVHTPHFDSSAVHIVSTAALAWLQSQLANSRIDERRFRPNIVVTTHGSAQVEQSWVGKVLRIGDCARLRITTTTERCRMTTLAQSDLPADPKVLRCIAQDAGLQFGVYAEVVEPGRVVNGDAISLDT